ncbi:MAG: UDP-N-acetylmuramate--L-alanine ligase [Erysipelotrichaceae bacterium]
MNNSEKLNLANIKSIHFIGIGGRSMSGLAKIAHSLNYVISGSDSVESPYTKELRKLKINITIGQSADNIKDPDLVVYTAAIQKDDPELLAAQRQTLTIERSKFLGALMKKYQCVIGVSGTHGKTTTTSMIAMILLAAKKNPSILLGGDLAEINGNTRVGSFDYLVAEACEYVDSFLQFHPQIATISNIDLEHLDYFKDIEDIKSSFRLYLENVSSDGYAVVNIDNNNVRDIITNPLKCQVVTYAIKDHTADYNARNIIYDELDKPTFDLYQKDQYLDTISLAVAGEHNVLNALSAIAASICADCSLDQIKAGFRVYQGTKRRYDTIGIVDGVRVMEDVAHVPVQMSTVLSSLRKSTKGKIYAVFQPHTYSRTKNFLNEYVDSFDLADEVIVCRIYPAREKDTGLIHGKDLVAAINQKYHNKAIYLPEFMDVADYVKTKTVSGDLIIAMGSGDIWQFCDLCLERMKKGK